MCNHSAVLKAVVVAKGTLAIALLTIGMGVNATWAGSNQPSRRGDVQGARTHYAQNNSFFAICEKTHAAECLMQGAIDCYICDDDNEKNQANAYHAALNRACRASHADCRQILQKYYSSYNPCEKDSDEDDK